MIDIKEKSPNPAHRPEGTPDSATTSPPRKPLPSTRSKTEQNRTDAREKRQHTESENALSSTQDKNPIPPGSTRR